MVGRLEERLGVRGAAERARDHRGSVAGRAARDSTFAPLAWGSREPQLQGCH
jgi:hypothetical protein